MRTKGTKDDRKMAASIVVDPDEFAFSLDDLDLTEAQEDDLLREVRLRLDALATGRNVPGITVPYARDRWSLLDCRGYKVLFTRLTSEELGHHGLPAGTVAYYLLRINRSS